MTMNFGNTLVELKKVNEKFNCYVLKNGIRYVGIISSITKHGITDSNSVIGNVELAIFDPSTEEYVDYIMEYVN